MKNIDELSNKTIKDFGEQWTIYNDKSGYFGSTDLFVDWMAPLLNPDDINGKKVADIGSGTGRFVFSLLELGAKHVIALEPSDAFEVLKSNMGSNRKVTCLQLTGDRLPAYGDIDLAVSIGVIHHIPDPRPVIKAVYNALRPGGRFLVWLYGKEGNFFYLSFLKHIRLMSTKLSHKMLSFMVDCLYLPAVLYLFMCKLLPLPLSKYFNVTWRKLTKDKRKLVIYDQLNPAYAKYYSKNEAINLLQDCGFKDIEIYHRRGYSWTVLGTK